MKKKAKPRQGGQLNRSETLTVRLDPKLNYLCELGARSQRRTKSSLVEAALATSLSLVPLDPRIRPGEEQQSIADLGEALWHVREVERLRRLALFAPHLMNYDEQRIWAVLSANGYFWHGAWEFYAPDQAIFRADASPDHLIVERVEQHWDEIKIVALHDKNPSSLPVPVYVIPWDDRLQYATMAPQALTEDGSNG
jgi:hypothetical protein